METEGRKLKVGPISDSRGEGSQRRNTLPNSGETWAHDSEEGTGLWNQKVFNLSSATS